MQTFGEREPYIRVFQPPSFPNVFMQFIDYLALPEHKLTLNT